MNAKKNKSTNAPEATEAATEQENTTTATEQEASVATQTDTSVEAQADADAELDISDEDRQTIRDAAAKVFEDGGEPAAKPTPIDGPVPLLGKTQGDAAAEAHAAGLVEAKPQPETPAQEPARKVQVIDGFELPAGFNIEGSGYKAWQVVDAAIAAHEANREYCESLGDMSQPDWMMAPEWQRVSALNGVCFAITNNFPAAETMHINWMKEKIAAGWRWGSEKNSDAKTHPCIMPYNQLPDEQRKKDDIFRDTIMAKLGPRAASAQQEKGIPALRPQEARAMNSMLACALAMAGLLDDNDDWPWPEVGLCLADFYRHEPTAPAAAGLMQLKLKLKVILLPEADPRRVELSLDLFRLALIRMEEFIAADAKAEIASQAAPLPTARNRLDGEGPFDKDDDRLTKSDTGKSLEQRAV